MNLLQRSRKFITTIALVVVLMTTAACSGVAQKDQTTYLPGTNGGVGYEQIERGNTAVGQDFGTWVVQTAKGLVQDAYVRGNDQLGVVISPQVRPNEVRQLAKSLVQGFQHNFPNKDLKVLVYAPDKQLILTAKYDNKSRQIQYQS